MIEWLLFNAKWVIVQLYYDERKSYIRSDDDDSLSICYCLEQQMEGGYGV
jgi:hypothetical protein